jgi:ribonuclease P protein component
MVGRLIHKADFERLMSAPVWSRSTHFALHHLAQRPTVTARRLPTAGTAKISTDLSETGSRPVDNKPAGLWAGAVVPKRHARRAVTRNLIKRQVRQAFERHEPGLPQGLWLVRLKRMYAAPEFVSARSERLAEAARAELEELLRRARSGRGG